MEKTWFITGSSSGIGLGIAKAVLAQGDNAVVMARSAAKLESLVQQYPQNALAVSLELTDRNSIRRAVQAAQDRFGSIDVLVNNAGHGYRVAVEEGEDEAVAELYGTNLFGPVELIKAVLPQMRERRSGAIGGRLRILRLHQSRAGAAQRRAVSGGLPAGHQSHGGGARGIPHPVL